MIITKNISIRMSRSEPNGDIIYTSTKPLQELLRLASQKEAEAAKKKRRAAEADQKRAGAALAFSILTGIKQPIDLPSIGTTKHTILTADDNNAA